ncbi:MAG: hypothetical protein IJD36_01595 [Clostridia bacterium]|nr:hypothetical protein [Clostridia bacterium]
MAREKELFRDNLVRLDEAFPGQEWLGQIDVLNYTGIKDRRTIYKRFGITKAGVSKVKLASLLS